MVKASKDENGGKAQDNPEVEERKRLKKVAFSKKLFSQTPARPISTLSPSKIVSKHHGRDVLKKSQRKNRFLFSFPGLLAPITGGKIGELKDLGTKNPILYLDFPQGQMKLFGTIVYPKNRYLTLQFSKAGKNVTCDDYFDNMIVFSEAWWIGRKDENPEEIQLDFPKELTEGQHVDVNYDFKGGAGVTSEEKLVASNPGKEYVDLKSRRADPEDDISRDSDSITGDDLKDMMEVTPTRHSSRTAGRKINFAEPSSGDDSEGSSDMDAEIPEIKVKTSSEHLDDAVCTVLSNKIEDSLSVKKSKAPSFSPHGPLVQTTISTMFEKMEEKKSKKSLRKSPRSKVSGQKVTQTDLKQKAAQAKDEKPRKKGSMIKGRKSDAGAGVRSVVKKVQSEVEDDEIELFSSESEDIDGSDEDWAG
ncbi:hypothetical protein NE237_007153 [Protea cynaroides]|uniref:DNA-binding protein RHL1 n=1 Tax=Protea cynaroides TaxID=273540 RepID=A0A9Q0QW72_9MAGN|nr:hypothetical protein NE237_007153 [Protea cynaroides]